MTGYVISKDCEYSTVEGRPRTIFTTTTEGAGTPAHWTPVLHFALQFRYRQQAARALHAGGWHRSGWRVENARRYRLGVQ